MAAHCLNDVLNNDIKQNTVFGYIKIKMERSPAQLAETGLKQFFRLEGYRREARKSLKNMVGRRGIEPRAR